jgi:hypothetical protein
MLFIRLSTIKERAMPEINYNNLKSLFNKVRSPMLLKGICAEYSTPMESIQQLIDSAPARDAVQGSEKRPGIWKKGRVWGIGRKQKTPERARVVPALFGCSARLVVLRLSRQNFELTWEKYLKLDE